MKIPAILGLVLDADHVIFCHYVEQNEQFIGVFLIKGLIRMIWVGSPCDCWEFSSMNAQAYIVAKIRNF